MSDAVMPGSFVCKKCGFILTLQSLNVGDGSMTAVTPPKNPKCENDGTTMHGLTWRQANHELYQMIQLHMNRFRWLNAHGSFQVDSEYAIAALKRGELDKIADAGLAADKLKLQ